jgi:hypothetical protein
MEDASALADCGRGQLCDPARAGSSAARIAPCPAARALRLLPSRARALRRHLRARLGCARGRGRGRSDRGRGGLRLAQQELRQGRGILEWRPRGGRKRPRSQRRRAVASPTSADEPGVSPREDRRLSRDHRSDRRRAARRARAHGGRRSSRHLRLDLEPAHDIDRAAVDRHRARARNLRQAPQRARGHPRRHLVGHRHPQASRLGSGAGRE